MRCHGQALARDSDGERYKLQASTPGYDRDRASDLAPSVSQSVSRCRCALAGCGRPIRSGLCRRVRLHFGRIDSNMPMSSPPPFV